MRIRKFICGAFVFLPLLFASSCQKNIEDSSTAITEASTTSEIETTTTTNDEIRAEIKLSGYGSIIVVLDKENAPLTVEHFVKLIENKEYDNTYINRIQPDFVVQAGAGCKNTETIKGEFKENGVENNLSHHRGVLSMARGTSYDSASSQFFFVLNDQAIPSLDNLYASFGYVESGMDILDDMANNLTIDMVTQDYYGYYMGFLNSECYIVIESVRLIK